MIKVSHVMFMSELPGVHPFSGLENHLLILLPALRRSGIEVEFIVMTWNIGPELKARLAKLEVQGITITIVPCSPRRQWRWLGLRRVEQAARLRAVLALRRDRIIHLHIDLGLAGLALFGLRCPRVVVSIHNDDPWMLQPVWRGYLHSLDRLVGHYLAISDRVRGHYLTACGAAPEKITRVYYGLEVPQAQRPPQELRHQLGIPEGRFVVGFVGRLTAQKNVPLLLAALKQVPEAQGVIIGDGELRTELETWVRNAGLSNVQFLGRRPQAADLMPAFDALCLPSKFEGLGLVLVEAMLRGVFIIGSRAGAIPEILGNGQYGQLFESDDVPALVTAIDLARRDPSHTQIVAQRALEYARHMFSMEVMTEQTLQVYRNLP